MVKKFSLIFLLVAMTGCISGHLFTEEDRVVVDLVRQATNKIEREAGLLAAGEEDRQKAELLVGIIQDAQAAKLGTSRMQGITGVPVVMTPYTGPEQMSKAVGASIDSEISNRIRGGLVRGLATLGGVVPSPYSYLLWAGIALLGGAGGIKKYQGIIKSAGGGPVIAAVLRSVSEAGEWISTKYGWDAKAKYVEILKRNQGTEDVRDVVDKHTKKLGVHMKGGTAKKSKDPANASILTDTGEHG